MSFWAPEVPFLVLSGTYHWNLLMTFEPLSPWASVYTVSGKKLPATITPWSTSHSALSSRVRWRNTSHRHCPEPPMSLADNAKFKSVGNWAPGKDHTMKKAQRRRCECYTDNVYRAKKCKTDQGNNVHRAKKKCKTAWGNNLPVNQELVSPTHLLLVDRVPC